MNSPKTIISCVMYPELDNAVATIAVTWISEVIFCVIEVIVLVNNVVNDPLESVNPESMDKVQVPGQSVDTLTGVPGPTKLP